MEHRGSTWQNQEPRGGQVFPQAPINAYPNTRTPCARLLPSAAQPPTSKTTRSPTVPITDATPGPQAGAMLGSDLQPPTSTLEGGMAPVPRREDSSRANRQMRQRLQRQGRGRERGAGESGRPSWRRQQEERGSGRVTGWGRQDYRTMGEGQRVVTGGEKVLSPNYRGMFVSLPQRHVGILTRNVMVLVGRAFG